MKVKGPCHSGALLILDRAFAEPIGCTSSGKRRPREPGACGGQEALEAWLSPGQEE